MRMTKWIVIASTLAAATVLAAGALPDLNIFKSGGMNKGLWKVQILSSSDPKMMQGAGAMGSMGICMDMTEKLVKQDSSDANQCSPTVVKNGSDSAEINVSCADGHKAHVLINRDADKSYVIDSDMTDKSGATRNIKARYTYQGECKGDSMIQMDKNSAACKQMGQVDMSKMAGMCANLPAERRAQCEQQMKNMMGSCQ